MMPRLDYGEISWERMIGAVEKVRQRLLRAAAALDRAGVPYAVTGGNARRLAATGRTVFSNVGGLPFHSAPRLRNSSSTYFVWACPC
jgi:hypothetical protein